jgi:hypothetical protein
MDNSISDKVETKPKPKSKSKSKSKKKAVTAVVDVDNPVEPPPNVTRTFKNQRKAKEEAKVDGVPLPKPKIGIICAIEEKPEDVVQKAAEVAKNSVYCDRVISTITVYKLMQDCGLFLNPIQKARFIAFMQEIEDVLREFVVSGFLRERKITVAEIIRTS